jgi:hypothetical protein
VSRNGDKPRSLERRLQLAHVSLATAKTQLLNVLKYRPVDTEAALEPELLEEVVKLEKAVERMAIWNARLLYKHRQHSDEVLKAKYEKASP